MMQRNDFISRWLVMNRRLDRFFNKALAIMRISPAQIDVLNVVADRQKCSPKEIQGELGLDSSSLTGLVQRIQKKGWIKKIMHPGDKRAVLLCLTTDGIEMQKKADHLVKELNRAVSSAASEEEWKTFYDVLRKIEHEFLYL
ncbi:MAG: MarR family transcriptional regulator [Candidatus Aureabacteria bacterium]|nr:MarR family transcriptional regulator [Candidatus Auribacterota bacterium]